MKLYRFILCSSLLVMYASSAVFGAFAVDPSADAQTTPDIDGSMVVWAEFVSSYGDYDILGIDLESAAGYIYIVGMANDQTHPQIDGTKVTWQDDFYGDGSDFDVYLSDIADPANIRQYPVGTTENIIERNPALSGNTVVWQVNTGSAAAPAWDVMGADMSDPNAPYIYVVDGFENNQTKPAVYRNTVVYQDDTAGDQDLWSADVWIKNNPAYAAVMADAETALEQSEAAVWRTTIVYQEQNTSGDYDILAVDLSNPAVPQVLTIADGPANQQYPDISGPIVVWQDDRNGDWDIYAYNLVTRQEFRITSHAADQRFPAVSGDMVVWEDDRDGVTNIWGEYLDAGFVAACPVPPAGDSNGDCQVTLQDFAVMAQNWLACSLVPAEACNL